MAVPDFVLEDLARLELEVPAGQLEQLEGYLHRVLEQNKRMNLTAFKEVDTAWQRLIVDSLTAAPGMPEPGPEVGPIADIGTGGGFPGVPLAIVRPDLQFNLVETTTKKAEFVNAAAEAVGAANVTVINERAEVVGRHPEFRAVHEVVVSRAVGAIAVVLEWSMPLARVGGRCLLMKGPRAEAELEAAADALAKLGAGEVAVIDAYPEGFDNQLVFVSVVKAERTAGRFPREPGAAKREPL